MRHFIAYHNTAKMGESLIESGAFEIFTNNSISNPVGETMWVVEGVTEPERDYLLGSKFIVSLVEDAIGEDFKFVIRGTGDPLPQGLSIKEEPWFPELFRQSAHFSRGVHEIKDQQIIDGLMQFAASHS